MKISHSDAGRLGYARSKDKLDAERERTAKKSRLRWEEEDKHCPACGKRIPYEKRQHRFCNHSCAASFNNRGVQRHGKPHPDCPICGEPVVNKSKGSTYCSLRCAQDGIYQKRILGWLDGEDNGIRGNGQTVARFIRRWVQERDGEKCSICGTEFWMGQKVSLILDHEDGNSRNNLPENLRMVCGNCDMQLPTYKGRNAGSGRQARRKRYKEGKSY